MKIKKLISILLVVSIFTFTFCISSNAAIKYSSYYYSLTSTTGSYKSYYNIQMFTTPSDYPEPDSGNAGVYFYVTSVGLPDSFVTSSSRVGTIMLAEDDIFTYDDIVCYYKGYFSVNSNGLYRMNSYGRVEAHIVPEVIENDGTLELYIKVNIDYITGDLTTNVPAELFLYRIWAY